MSQIELSLETEQQPMEPKKIATDLAVIEQQASSLTPEELKQVNDFAKKIDFGNTEMITRYGESVQGKSADFSKSALQGVKNKDLDVTGGMITSLVVQLKGIKLDPGEKKKGLANLFRRGRSYLEELRTQYTEVSTNVEKIKSSLAEQRELLFMSITRLDRLFEGNILYYKELGMYIAAGKKKLDYVRDSELPALKEKAVKSGLQEDAQRVNDLVRQCDRFERRIYDLELTRNICIQMAPQIRLVQESDFVLAEKIQSSIANTIPLWENQMVLALSMEHGRRALETQQQVSDLTNKMLKNNADVLKQNTIGIAREAERGIVDIETLKYMNESLISTFEELATLGEEGKQRRVDAQGELVRIDGNVKAKLLESGK